MKNVVGGRIATQGSLSVTWPRGEREGRRERTGGHGRYMMAVEYS